mgnify:CR=1 FL=1
MNPIKQLIALSGYSQKDFAQKVGEKEGNLSLYANEKRQISLKKFLQWCEVLGIEDWHNLFEKEKNNTPM